MEVKPLKICPKDRLKVLKTFWRYVKIIGMFDCWEWQGRKRSGYGHLHIPGHKSNFWAHRISYALFNGPIKENMQIDHRCRNRACVNPLHLRQCTASDNMLAIRRRKLRERQHTIFPLL